MYDAPILAITLAFSYVFVYICMYMKNVKVFFTASYSGKAKYQQKYNWVVNAIKRNSVELISPEIGNYLDTISAEEKKNFSDERVIHYEAIRRGILWADLVIIETSDEKFQVGHEATIAMTLKKPVLALSIYEDFGKKIKHKYFQGSKYNGFNIDEIVTDFITKHSKEQYNLRFNLFLSKNQLERITKESEKVGLNKSEYIRRLIDDDSKSL